MEAFIECFLVSILIDHSAVFDSIDPSQTHPFFLSSSFSGVHDTMLSGFTFYFYVSFVGVLTCPLTLVFLKLPFWFPLFSVYIYVLMGNLFSCLIYWLSSPHPWIWSLLSCKLKQSIFYLMSLVCFTGTSKPTWLKLDSSFPPDLKIYLPPCA